MFLSMNQNNVTLVTTSNDSVEEVEKETERGGEEDRGSR